MKRTAYLQYAFALGLSMALLMPCMPNAHAKKLSGLKLKSSVINASLFNKSKNDLVIENGKGLKRTLLVQVQDGSTEPVKIEGELIDGALHCDLSQLGDANELKQGTYVLTARRGKKKLQAQFELNPPTVYKNTIKVPINSLSKEGKERILRNQVTLEGDICYSDPCPTTSPDEPRCLAPVIDVACDDPSCNMGPCTNGQTTTSDKVIISCGCHDPENLDQVGEELHYIGEIEGDYITADVLLETTADYQKEDVKIEAEILVDGVKEAELSNICFGDQASEETNTVESELNNATTTATDLYIAANTESTTLQTEDVKLEDIKFENLYNETVEKCEPLIDSQKEETAKALIASIAQEMAEQFKEECLKAISKIEGNIGKQIAKLAIEKAAVFGAKCPNFVGLPPTDLIMPEKFDMVEYHEIAGGLLDPVKLGLEEDAKVIFDLFQKEGIIAGSLKDMPWEEAKKLFEAGKAPVYNVDSLELGQGYAEMQKIASELGYEMPKDIVVPPGTIFNPELAVSYLQEKGIQNAEFTLASSCIVEGQFDPSKFSSEFKFNAEPGVIAHESFNNIFNSIELQSHDFLPGTVLPGENVTAVLPPSITEYINTAGNFTIPELWSTHPPTPEDLAGMHPPIGSSDPAPTGWLPTNTSNPVPTGWKPTSGEHLQPMPTSPVPTTTEVVAQPAPTYVAPTTPPPEYHPPTSH